LRSRGRVCHKSLNLSTLAGLTIMPLETLEEQGQGVSQELELIHLGWVDYNAP